MFHPGRRILAWAAALTLAAGLTACGAAAAPTQPTPSRSAQEKPAQPPAAPAAAAAASASSAPITVTDDTGRSVTLKGVPSRIVSLAPANTELLYALGAGDRVVAVDEFSDYPPEAKNKAVIKGLRPNLEQLIALNPDLVLYVGGMQEVVTQLEGKNVPVAVLSPKDLGGIYRDVELVSKLTGDEQAGKKLASDLRQRVEAVVARTSGASRPRVFYEIDASDPTKPYTAGPGSFVDSLISMAGGANVASGAKVQWAQFSLEELIASDPEIVVLADALVDTNPQTPEIVAQRPGWDKLAAVKKNTVYPIDTNVVSRPGPRIADGLEQLARLIHPELFR